MPWRTSRSVKRPMGSAPGSHTGAAPILRFLNRRTASLTLAFGGMVITPLLFFFNISDICIGALLCVRLGYDVLDLSRASSRNFQAEPRFQASKVTVWAPCGNLEHGEVPSRGYLCKRSSPNIRTGPTHGGWSLFCGFRSKPARPAARRLLRNPLCSVGLELALLHNIVRR